MNTEKGTSKYGVLNFFKTHPVFTCYSLIVGVSIVLHRLWIEYNLPTYYGMNYMVLFILPVIGRKSRNIVVKKASEATLKTWFALACLVVLNFIINLPIFDNVSYSKKTKPIVTIAPTLKQNDLIDCKINERCGGGTKKLTYDQCKDTVCCGVGDKWIFLPHTEQCRKAQMVYHGLLDKEVTK